MKAHRTDGVSLSFAIIFLAIVGWWLLAQVVDLDLPAVGWFVAGALILLGVLGLFGALRAARQPPPAPVEPVEPVEPVDPVELSSYPEIEKELSAGVDPVSSPPGPVPRD
jgi:hypothetical protein